ncbi:MAG: PQQ-binding-like beta-propeller repeat protein [Phycisphaerae bacterium]
MTFRRKTCAPPVLALILTLAAVAAGPSASAGSPEGQARMILDDTGVAGGLVVHLGCGDGHLAAAIGGTGPYLVQGLAPDAKAVEPARAPIRSKGLYGKVSVIEWTGDRLPYAENLVNLLVADDLGKVPMEEVMRVLAPEGVALIGGKKTVKPRPDDIDEWTHSLYGPGSNPVSADRRVGPPRHLQWTCGPRWARSHGWTPSVSSMVSAGGRLFTICDETLTCAGGNVPSRWFLTARDAFSGVELWKVPVPNWDSKDFSGTPGHGAVPRFTMPPQVYKRLVTDGETVYATLGARAPVSALDAATGKVRRVYEETARAHAVLLSEGRLICPINPAERPAGGAPDPAPGKQVCAVDTATGRLLWKKGPFTAVRTTKQQDPCGRLELAAGGGGVYALTDTAITCLEADTGKRRWRTDRPALPEAAVTKIGFGGVYEYLLSVMVYHDGVVLLAQPEPNTHHTYHTMPGTVYAFDARTGKQLWKHGYGGWGHCTPPDCFVVKDAVWTHVDAETEFGRVWGNGYRAKNSGQVDYRIQALDLHTGKPRTELGTKTIFNVGHHHRCTRNRITERFLMSTRRGVEFVDLSSGENWQNHWVRGGCLLGYLPCNGLLYVTPHPCSCYLEAKLVGFNALAPKRTANAPVPETPDDHRLVKGPASDQPTRNPRSEIRDDSWPTYRHDARRSGATEAAVPTDLAPAWTADIGTGPSAPVVAAGKVFVAGVDTHTVHALSAADGKEAWRHTAGGRVDSPPTVYGGRALFGSADGRVTCLRAADGALAWRFDAAPGRQFVTAFGQVESAWPVPGSVLVAGGTCWLAAGRSSYLDGGIRFWGLDPATGKVVHRETFCHRDPETGKQPPTTSAHGLPGLLNDVPASDGSGVFIRQMKVRDTGGKRGLRVYMTGGYLDDSWFNRTYWKARQAQTSGVMVLGDGAAYGMEVFKSRSRETVFQPGTKPYRLRCLPLEMSEERKKDRRKRRQGPADRWERRLDIRVTALVRAGDVLFAAGSPDVVDPDDPHAAWQGRKGGVLAAFATADGKELARYRLPAPPVWDGLAAAGGRLYVATMGGKILCFEGK